MIKFMRKLKKQFQYGEKGFTLIELLIVIAVLGILAAVAVPQLLKFIGSGKNGAANAELGVINTAMQAGMADKGATTITNGTVVSSAANQSLVTGVGVTFTVGDYIQGGAAKLDGTFSFNSYGFVTGATYPGAGAYDTAAGKFQ